SRWRPETSRHECRDGRQECLRHVFGLQNLRLIAALVLSSTLLFGQANLNPAKLLQPPTDTWPVYHGDYSGRRFSTLSKINASNVSSLSLAWVYRQNLGPGQGGVRISATPLEINGVLYFTIPDHIWAVDARDGREIWHRQLQSKGGMHIGNRGLGAYGN